MRGRPLCYARGALGNGGAFASAPSVWLPGQRTAGQTLSPPVRPLPKTRILRRSARHDCPGRHRNPAHEDPGGICEQAARPPRAGQRYFELSRPFLSHASPRHPAGRPASLFMTLRLIHDPPAGDALCRDELRRGPPRLRTVRLRGLRPSVTRHGAADAYSADAPEPPPRSWSQRVVEARCQDARGPADLAPNALRRCSMAEILERILC